MNFSGSPPTNEESEVTFQKYLESRFMLSVVTKLFCFSFYGTYIATFIAVNYCIVNNVLHVALTCPSEFSQHRYNQDMVLRVFVHMLHILYILFYK